MVDRMALQCYRILLLCLHVVASMSVIPTPSPPSAFDVSPSNRTVLIGHPTVLKCKLKEPVHTCRWYHMEASSSFFDPRLKLTPIMEFRASKNTDCSIKFSKTNMDQTGQWLCQGLIIHQRKYIVSQPAFLTVLEEIELPLELTTTEIPEHEEDPDESPPKEFFSTISNIDGHIINTHLGYEVLLDCQATSRLQNCRWIIPNGLIYTRDGNKPFNYPHIQIVGDMDEGNCSLLTTVQYQDEGNWRCIVTADGKLDDKVGPLIHLHILELGPHGQGGHEPQEAHQIQEKGASLVTILVSTLVLLLLVVVILSLYIYKQKWFQNLPQRHFNTASETGSDYSTYGRPWLPPPPYNIKEHQLLQEGRQMEEDGAGTPGHPNNYTRYLDMTGGSGGSADGYVAFPSSIRSSTSSRTTLSTIPARGRHNSTSNNSGHASICESMPSIGSFDDLPFDKIKLERSPSVYSSGHLYEEIKYGKKLDFDQQTTSNTKQNQANSQEILQEDHEGYILPKETELKSQQAPPYSKVSDSGLVPAIDESNWASNPTYGVEKEPKNNLNQDSDDKDELIQQTYDTPPDPPIPIREDSADDNPLANYDVPNKVHVPVTV